MYNKTKHKCRKHFCIRCLHGFSSEEILEKHKDDCKDINSGNAATKIPKPYIDKNGQWRKPTTHFKNHNKKLAVPFMIFADFEAILEEMPRTIKKSDDIAYTEKERKHMPCSYSYKLICCHDNKYSKPKELYRGDDVINKFIESLREEEKYCLEVLKNNFNKPLVMSKEDEESFKNANECHICEKKYKEGENGVRDHCHITGKYRGSAHNACNSNFKISDDSLKIPVVFHNLRGYDGHLIVRETGGILKEENKRIDIENEKRYRENAELYKKYNKEEYEKIKKNNLPKIDIRIIPKNTEQYLTFSLGKHLSFIDSAQFLNSSLELLAKNQNRDSLKYTREYFTNDADFELARKKGVYPYSYMDSFEKFNENRLPDKQYFYNDLVQRDIKDEDYEHAKKVWNTLNLQNMGEYHDFYLITDVLLTADIFENFRSTCIKHYGLDPANYLSSPSLAWDVALKSSGVYLEQLTDINAFIF